VSALDISVQDTLNLLDSSSEEFSNGVVAGEYVFWLGSGISRGRTADLERVILKVLVFVHDRIASDSSPERYRKAMRKILDLVPSYIGLPVDTLIRTHPETWSQLSTVLSALLEEYAKVLDVQVNHELVDHLLWDGTEFVETFGAIQSADTEHLAIAVLISEGAVRELASANWDGLIETAFTEITPTVASPLEVRVRTQDFQKGHGRPQLLKFHGCAQKAAEDPDEYRKLLVGRRRQLTDWPNEDVHAVMRDELVKLASQRPTLMIGLSAQDTDIQDLFSKAKKAIPWVWPSTPPKHVFAEEALGGFQTDLLAVVYGDAYGAISGDVERTAIVPAYGKPLLTALMLQVFNRKFQELLGFAPSLSRSAASDLQESISYVRDLLAAGLQTDSASVTRFIRGVAQLLEVFRTGATKDEATLNYTPISPFPVGSGFSSAIATTSGMPQLSVAIALLAKRVADAGMTLKTSATALTGAIEVHGSGKSSTVYFFASEASEIAMLKSGGFASEASRIVIVRATYSSVRQSRSPSRAHRIRGGVRTVSISSLLASSSTEPELLQRFQESAVI